MTKVISKDGTKIAFEKVGKGPAIVLVDGAMAYREYFGGRGLAAELAKDFTVYAYDRRRRGAGGARAVTMPVLVLDGELSDDFKHEAADAVAQAMPDARRITIEGQSTLVSPEILAPILRAFFDSAAKGSYLYRQPAKMIGETV